MVRAVRRIQAMNSNDAERRGQFGVHSPLQGYVQNGTKELTRLLYS
jgi:hypothetical protein